MLIQELVVLVQRSEEYTYFLTSHMRDAVSRDTEKQQAAAAAAAQRHSHLQGRLSLTQLDITAARDGGGMLIWGLVHCKVEQTCMPTAPCIACNTQLWSEHLC